MTRKGSGDEAGHGSRRSLWVYLRTAGLAIIALGIVLYSMGGVSPISNITRALAVGSSTSKTGAARQAADAAAAAPSPTPVCIPYIGCLPTDTPVPTDSATPTPTSSATATPTPTGTDTAVAGTATATPTNIPGCPSGETCIGSGVVGPGGGTVSGTEGTGHTISVTFPPGAVTTSVTVFIGTVPTPPASIPDGNQLIGLPFVLSAFDPSGNPVTTFNGEDVTVTFSYNPGLNLPACPVPTPTGTNCSQESVEFTYYDTTSQSWQPLTIVAVDPTNLLVTATTTHFTTFSMVNLLSYAYCAASYHTDAFRATGDIFNSNTNNASSGDGIVDIADLSVFSNDWLKFVTDPTLITPYSDMSCNSQIGIADLSIFSQLWLLQATGQP